MGAVKEEVQGDTDRTPAGSLDRQVLSVLDHAVDAHRRGLKVYQSLQNLNEVIGTEYGDRVLYELIQNAHDAHSLGGIGRIAIELVVRSKADGVLYIANGGSGFRAEDVEAIKNLATSAKEVGEGIGNKGLGFRSIEALTNDVRIYSRRGDAQAERFDGYCFRFAEVDEIEGIIRSGGIDATTSRTVAESVPRYLVPRPLEEQPDEIIAYARRGYATVVVLPLSTAEAVALASRQVDALADENAPLLLFLDRIAEVRIDVERPDRTYQRRLSCRRKVFGDVPSLPGARLEEVDVGQGRRFLVVRREVDKQRVLDAVEKSISAAPQIKRWLNWKGIPVVSIAVGLSTEAVTTGRLYNFLPMGEEAKAPLIGFLDAPFFADIDRREARSDLPLNQTLMEMVAETSIATALSIVERDLPFPAQAVFDLFAWSGEEAKKLDAALEKASSSTKKARVIPAIAAKGQRSWSSLSEISIWPEGSFGVLKDREIAKHVGAQLVSSDLDGRRIDRLKEVARRTFCGLTPSSAKLSEWSEAFARSLVERKAKPRTWSRFYDDLPRVFEAAGATFEELDGKAILYDRSAKLRAAGGHIDGSSSGVFVRRDVPKGKRKKAGVPLPPATLVRRYRFLHERINLRRETLDAFVEAGLVREFDPVEALAGLKSALGKKANQKRREEALIWAFRVWRAAGTRTEDELQEAELYVPTLSGWYPASHATFSSSWSSIGKTLERYVIEAAEISADCRRARDLLLVGQQDWPVSVQDEKRNWHRFLELIGVREGLRPVPADLTRDGSPAYLWDDVLRSGKPTEGLDKGWCAEASRVSFYYPYTDYNMEGEAWRLPGQIEHEALTESAKEAFCNLVFDHLKTHGTAYFEFQVGRFERYKRLQDPQTMPTPLATFLRSRAWISVATQDGLAFRSPRDCWASRLRRGGPPRFLDRILESVLDSSEGEGLTEIAFGDALGVRDWQSPRTAVDRLNDLGRVVIGLPSSDRPAWRREYHRAWQDVVETGISLPHDFTLVVTRRGQLETLSGEHASPAAVIVTEDAQRFEARVLASAGQPVLEVGPTATQQVSSLLEKTGAFVPKLLDGLGVQLLLDDKPFAPREDDPLLTSLGLEWLPEIIVIGHELRGEQLERGIQSATVDRRARSIRVRRCRDITLVVDAEEIMSSDRLLWYAFEHDDLPTLILTADLTLNWVTLAGPLSGGISRLIDPRLRSARLLLSQLALYRPSDELQPPNDEILAMALESDADTIQDHRAARRTDLEHVLYLLVPVVAYYGNLELSRKLQSDVDHTGARFDPCEWLKSHLEGQAYSPQDLVDACERAPNRGELRRELKLDYERFNRVLLSLGEAPLSNETGLRQSYEAYLERMRPTIVDQLRRHYSADFQAGHDLATYVMRKSLSFLEFNTEWILTRETLEKEIVENHVSGLLVAVLGDDEPVELAPFKRVIEANRKAIREFVVDAVPVVRVWCRRNQAPSPELWQHGEIQSLVRHLENRGLLDFEILGREQIPAIFHRAGCWPEGMPETVDGKLLGLTTDDVYAEEKLRERELQEWEIRRRSIEFAGSTLDTCDPMFAQNLGALAEGWLAKDDTWFERSRRRTRLVEFNDEGHSGGSSEGGGKGGGTRRRERQLPDEQRQAMGLASEWLAYQFLHRRHPEFVDEACWISGNRVHFFGGDQGDDSAGFDFRVKTPQAEWLYEVKSSLEDSGEFELTANEIRVASRASKDGRWRYRILYVPYVFSPDKWYVLELPNPMGETTRSRFKTVGRGSVRLKFERQ